MRVRTLSLVAVAALSVVLAQCSGSGGNASSTPRRRDRPLRPRPRRPLRRRRDRRPRRRRDQRPRRRRDQRPRRRQDDAHTVSHADAHAVSHTDADAAASGDRRITESAPARAVRVGLRRDQRAVHGDGDRLYRQLHGDLGKYVGGDRYSDYELGSIYRQRSNQQRHQHDDHGQRHSRWLRRLDGPDRAGLLIALPTLPA